MQLIHGSSSKKTITEITSEGFGGLFACVDNVNATHGTRLYMMTSPNPMPSRSIVDGFYDACLSVAKGNELIADAIYSADCCGSDEIKSKLGELGLEAPGHYADDHDGGWSLQRLRGQAAALLGYTSVHMHDEHGMTVLCLPGCTMFEIAEYEASRGVVTSCKDTNGNLYEY